MLVHDSRVIQVTIFGTLQSNLNFLAVADEIDSPLTQSMDSYMRLMRKSMAA